MLEYTSIQPPKLAGIRYSVWFLLLQFTNAVRYYICPDELNFKHAPFTHVTLVIIIMANAGAFFHGLDGNKHNWEVVQNCMMLVGSVYMFNVSVCLFFAYKSQDKLSDDGWYFVWDQLLHWHEAFVTSAMWTIAKAEARYYETVEHLERTNAEYNAERTKKKRNRKKKQNPNENGNLELL